MRHLMRGLVGLIGLLALLLALRLWIDPAIAGAALGFRADGLLGLASLRADVAGFFAAAGVFSLAGALRNDRALLTAPLLMIALALSGRLITAVLGGIEPSTIAPMAVEAVLLAVLALGRRVLGP